MSALLVAALGAAWPSLAWAHGAAPGVLGIAARKGAELRALRLSEGLAVRTAKGGWRYVCAPRWQAPDAPVAGSADGDLVVVSGTMLQRISATGLQISDDSRWYTCLDEVAGVSHACARTQLIELDGSGKPGPLRFALLELQPPSLAGLDAATRDTCRGIRSGS